MNLLLFADGDRIAPGLIEVSDQRVTHLLETLGATSGDRVRVGEIGGLMGHGDILAINPQRARLRIVLTEPPPAKLPVSLVVALPRPKMLRRILRNAAEFGVRELHLINSYRVQKSYWQTPVLTPATTRAYLLQGLQQARDTRLPTVHCHRRFKPWVEDTLPAQCRHRQSLLAHPGSFPPCPRQLQGETLLVVGPEGGFIPYEVEKLLAAGCSGVSLGPRILRVENAVTALLARLA